MWKNTMTRITTAAFGVALFIVVIFFMPNWALDVAVSAVILVMLFELFHAFGYGRTFTLLGCTGSLFLVIVQYPQIFQNISGSIPFWGLDHFLGALVIYVIFIILIALVSHKKTEFSDIAIMLFATIYISCFTICVVRARDLDNGLFYVMLIFVCAWLDDTGAYFIGKLFGKHKLAPNISPKKTVEGSIGGIITAILFSMLLGIITQLCFDKSINYLAIGIIALVASCLGQIGDLVASLMKRQSGVKDFGNIMPGHGGMLDRFDSVILIAPFIYYAAKLLIAYGAPLVK